MMRDGQIVLKTSSGEVAGDMLLVAVGRTPNADTLDLHKAGVAFTDKGITVDEQLRTNVKHIFAAGDVIGGPQFTHVAAFQAFTATRNALFPGASTGQITNVPWTTFTDPEVARAGMSEEQAQEKFGAEGIDVRRWNMDRVDRAVTESDTSGFIKVVHKKDGTVVGATIVAERAGEIIHEWALAIERKWKVGDIAGTMHVYPTYAIANQQLASSYAIDAFMESTVAKLFNRLSRIFQWVLADRGSCLLG
jgi:pyruvate/2-oxoglutarate dehydrogenase complex dihydrolipoamide dehydrogenase (E3) component